MNQKIYGFAFGRTIASSVLYQIKNLDCCYLVFGISSIDGYMNFLVKHQPKYILGLGVYTGKDQGEIRIEKKCTNKFRNGFIEGNTIIEQKINPFLRPIAGVKFAEGIGNSYCNYISYRITTLIKSGDLKSKYCFLHIPISFEINLAARIIDKMVTKL